MKCYCCDCYEEFEVPATDAYTIGLVEANEAVQCFDCVVWATEDEIRGLNANDQ
jgi:hypothetical protein